MTTIELINYYAKLLILQYVGLPKAYDTIKTTIRPIIMPQEYQQQITFSPTPTSGTFTLSYDGNATSALNWNASAGTIQTALRLLAGLSTVTVSGTIATGLTVNYVGVDDSLDLLIVGSNSLMASAEEVEITLTEVDQTLPLAVQNAFDLNSAVGNQLDILGKYVGVARSINTPSGSFVLDDSDFLVLIKFAIVQNSSGSSLSDIEDNLNQFFPGQFIVTDFKNMYMSYILSASLGSSNLFRALVVENLIPRPMGVGISVFIPPVITDFFGFSSYNGPNPLVKPFNRYDDFNTTWLWLSYSNAVIV